MRVNYNITVQTVVIVGKIAKTHKMKDRMITSFSPHSSYHPEGTKSLAMLAVDIVYVCHAQELSCGIFAQFLKLWNKYVFAFIY